MISRKNYYLNELEQSKSEPDKEIKSQNISRSFVKNNNKSTNLLNGFDFKLFETDQEYNDKFKNYATPYDSDYYEIYLNAYLKSNKPNELVLVNFFTKLYSFTYDSETIFKEIKKFIQHFAGMTLTAKLIEQIFSNCYDKVDDREHNNYHNHNQNHKNTKLIYSKDTLERVFYSFNELVKISKLSTDINTNILYSNLELIKIDLNVELTDVMRKLLSEIFINIWACYPTKPINLNTWEFIVKFKLINPSSMIDLVGQFHYVILYKYETKITELNKIKKFNPNIDCLKNACTIKNNTTVVKNLLKKINPDSSCLTIALTHSNNSVVKLLLEKIQPTKEQILIYCELKNDLIMKALIEKLN